MADYVLASILEQQVAGVISAAEADSLRRDYHQKRVLVDSSTTPIIARKVAPAPSGYNPLDAVQAKALDEAERVRKAAEHVASVGVTRAPSQEGVQPDKGPGLGARAWQPHQRFPDTLVRVYLVHIDGPVEGAIPQAAPAGTRTMAGAARDMTSGKLLAVSQTIASRVYWIRDDKGALVRADQCELARIDEREAKGELSPEAAERLRLEARKLAPKGGIIKVETIDLEPPASLRKGARKLARPLARGAAMVAEHVRAGRGLAALQYRRAVSDYERLAEVESEIRKLGKPKSDEGKLRLARLKAERSVLKGMTGPTKGLCVCDHKGMELSHADRMALEFLAPGIAERPSDATIKEEVTFRCYFQGPICLHDPLKGRKPESMSAAEWLASKEDLPCEWAEYLDVTRPPASDQKDSDGNPIPGSGAKRTASELAAELAVGANHSLCVRKVEWKDPETLAAIVKLGTPTDADGKKQLATLQAKCKRTVTRAEALADLPEDEEEYFDPWRDEEPDLTDMYEMMTVSERNRHTQFMLGPPKPHYTKMHEPKVRLDYGDDGRLVWGNAHDSKHGQSWDRMQRSQDKR